MKEPSRTPYTPGPWRYSEDYHEVTVSKKGILEGSKQIARVSDFSKSKETIRANGYMMAAAPELYDALNWAVSELKAINEKYQDISIGDQLPKAIEAINKALGIKNHE